MDNRHRSVKSGATMGSGFWIAYTDIMTALLFIFIIILVFMVLQYNSKYNELEQEKLKFEKTNLLLKKEKEEIENRNKTLKSENAELSKYKLMVNSFDEADSEILTLLDKIKTELQREYGIVITLNKRNKTLHIDSEVVGFKVNEYNIESHYKDKVKIIGKVLYKSLNNSEKDVRQYIDAVFIEGYTDDRHLEKPETFGNWGLSALRAISFWEELNKSSSLNSLKNANNEKFLFSVSGYANVRPIECDEYIENNKNLDHLSCINYQKCMLDSNNSNYQECKNKYFNKNEFELYNNKNRRIGIRFIPYHKNPSAFNINYDK